jgi:hypothetical protein
MAKGPHVAGAPIVAAPEASANRKNLMGNIICILTEYSG